VTTAASLLVAAVDPSQVLVLACVLFGIGLVGVACRRNVLVVLLSVEILLNAANLAFVAFSRIHGNVTGQVFVFFAMAIAAAEVAVGLAIVIAVYRLRRVVDANAASDLRERDLGGVPPIEPEGRDTPHADHGHGHDEADAGHAPHVPSPEGHDPHGHATPAHATPSGGAHA
jgi:NADH-quinone oxidoreductase subunit K